MAPTGAGRRGLSRIVSSQLRTIHQRAADKRASEADALLADRLLALEQENRVLREHLHRLTREAGYNQKVLLRSHEREQQLLAAVSLPDLLRRMTQGMRESFMVSAVNLVLADPDHEIRRLLAHSRLTEASFPEVQLVDDLSAISPVYGRLCASWLGPYKPWLHTALFQPGTQVRSIAILPLALRDRLLGSLNLGSANKHRFTKEHSSDFLSRLAIVGAVCLDNICHYERTVISALTDALTGLYNRRYLLRRLEEEIKRAARYRQVLSCLFVDADHFKRINDEHGHQVGDLVLREIATRICAKMRANDVATRYGGEEFAVLLPQTKGSDAVHLAERMRLAVAAEPVLTDTGRVIPVTVSIGVGQIAPARDLHSTAAAQRTLLASADGALYRAKGGGRNRVVLDAGSSRERAAHGGHVGKPES
jgi:two-component system cell cycle response regulator